MLSIIYAVCLLYYKQEERKRSGNIAENIVDVSKYV